MEIIPSTKVNHLIREHPFLLDYLTGLKPEMEKLRNPLLRNTLGRVADLKAVSAMAGIPVDNLIRDIRVAILKDIVRTLHDGADPEQVKQRFSDLVGDADHTEVAAMEQQLIAEGMPEDEIKRLCNVHVGIFRESLDKRTEARGDFGVPSGHPLHTLRAENRAIEGVIEDIKSALDGDMDMQAVREAFGRLSEIDNHYLRKENQLFPALEAHGFEGPTKVMWAIHDDIRDEMKKLKSALDTGDEAQVRETGDRVVNMISDMIYKEENILFPTSLDLLKEEDWIRIRQGEDVLGYTLVRPGDEWEHSRATQDGSEIMEQRYGGSAAGTAEGLALDTGVLSLEQLNLMLRSLPLDISFVDENDEVRYYSEGDRIFPRSAGVIGRRVQNCHPPKSVALVEKILEEFRAGTKDVAEFWIPLHGKFVHIRYFALRDKNRNYKGTLEVVQDITKIRELSGERRLPDWQ